MITVYVTPEEHRGYRVLAAYAGKSPGDVLGDLGRAVLAERGLLDISAPASTPSPERQSPALVVAALAPAPTPAEAPKAQQEPKAAAAEKKCAECGKSFTPKPHAGPHVRFCSRKCKDDAAYERKKGKASA